MAITRRQIVFLATLLGAYSPRCVSPGCRIDRCTLGGAKRLQLETFSTFSFSEEIIVTVIVVVMVMFQSLLTAMNSNLK